MRPELAGGCSENASAYLDDCQARYLAGGPDSLADALLRDPLSEQSLGSECVALSAYSACVAGLQGMELGECHDLRGSLQAHLCVPEARLLLRATRGCRSQPGYPDGIRRCLSAGNQSDCSGLRQLFNCLADVAVQACESPELADILQRLLLVHAHHEGQDCRPWPRQPLIAQTKPPSLPQPDDDDIGLGFSVRVLSYDLFGMS